jgi:hypothetical protein
MITQRVDRQHPDIGVTVVPALHPRQIGDDLRARTAFLGRDGSPAGEIERAAVGSDISFAIRAMT